MEEHLFERLARERNITVEEMRLYYAVNTLIENGDEELLRRYPNLRAAALEGVHFG